MNIRPESVQDYTAISQVLLRAFDNQMGIVALVALLRLRQQFDPELSLVAEMEGRVVGHVLFSPYTVRLLDGDLRAVNLSPLAIDPGYQNQGVGTALVEEGHRLARAKGYPLSTVLGHPPYYPRFGYQTGVYGSASITINTDTLPELGGFSKKLLEQRDPIEGDIPTLERLWLHEEGGVDFALYPENNFSEWLSPNPIIASTVYLRDGEIVGYTRIRETEPTSPRIFLAADHDAALKMAGEIGFVTTHITLPLHPRSASASAFGVPTAEAWQAGMAMSLLPNPFDDYLPMVKAGARPPGRSIWPTPFDLAE